MPFMCSQKAMSQTRGIFANIMIAFNGPNMQNQLNSTCLKYIFQWAFCHEKRPRSL